ncbi:MAG: tRNA dihydrouridine synthase DusB [Propionibacteriaceae bacterium]|nr:tRNA dihydrouridine synthase DusB [Propionibacteriaceae bacterium]
MPIVLNAPSRPGAVVVDPPVVLAPMAGVTNAAFRLLCYEQGAGLAVCEMLTAQGIVAGNDHSASMMAFWDGEPVRSVQLYGSDPDALWVAVGIAVGFGAQHIDLNFGCPVPKVTRRGGGGALPWKLGLTRALIEAAVQSADRFGVPVTVKTRIGLDDDHPTYLDVARIAEDAGVAGLCLHARTVAAAYSGAADWSKITDVVAAVDIPVFGNGDVWEGADAAAMMAQTGCAGVEVGRGCLGRPWIFADIAAALAGRPQTTLPNLGEVCALLHRHAVLLVELMGETHAMKDIRKHTGWYLKGFPVGGDIRLALSSVTSLAELDGLLDGLDHTAPFPIAEVGRPRGRQGSPRGHVVLPYGWLDDRDGLGLAIDDSDAVGG